MIYELRIYRCVPGRMPSLLSRFENETLRMWEKHGIRQAGFWTTLIGKSSQEITYMLAWDSMAEREKRWGAFLADPEWVAVVAKTEKDGQLVETMSSVRMCVSTDDRIRNGARWARIKRSAGLGLLSARLLRAPSPPSPRSLPTISSSQRASVTGTTSTRWSSTKAAPSLRRWAECITFISIRPERPRSGKANHIRTRPCYWSICTNSPSPMAPTWKAHGRRPPSC